jgi:hypothetical protein
MLAQADAARIPLPDRSVDLVIGSPPYVDARLYLENGRNLGIARACEAWIDWMLGVTAEALRVSRGLVLWVVAGKRADWNYQPAPEGLLYRWWAQGGECHCLNPSYWHRVGIPGSGSGVWYRADIEYVLAFKRPGKPYGEPTANGHAPKYAPGGEMSHRITDGTRRNQWGGSAKSGGSRRADGSRQTTDRPSSVMTTKRKQAGNIEEQNYREPALANPGNLIHTNVGGGHLGSNLAHENEAPYPEAVPAWFINSHCPPGGLVLDPFSGSGTTVAAARSLGRRGIGFDLRQSQCKIAGRRLNSVTPGFTFTEALFGRPSDQTLPRPTKP